MNFHDDGEHGLGPVVSSLSLGGSASMHFRPKVKRSSRNLVYSKNPLVSTNVTSDYLPPHVPPKAKEGSGTAVKPELTLRLEHGDVMIMVGDRMQKVWEHMVEPLEGFRVAATCRRIGSSHAAR